MWLSSWLLGKLHWCYGLIAKEHKWIIVMKTWIPALHDLLEFIWWNSGCYETFWKMHCCYAIRVPLGELCSRHIMGNTSRQNHLQSVIINGTSHLSNGVDTNALLKVEMHSIFNLHDTDGLKNRYSFNKFFLHQQLVILLGVIFQWTKNVDTLFEQHKSLSDSYKFEYRFHRW